MGTRRFRADYLKGEGTGIGIVEYGGKHKKYNWEKQVLAIHSIYDKNNLSHRDIQVFIYQYLSSLLDDDEHAILQMNKFSRRQGHHLPYKNKISVFWIENERGRLYHAHLLAQDAIRRKTTICETFNEPMSFSIVEQDKEAQAYCKKEKRGT